MDLMAEPGSEVLANTLLMTSGEVEEEEVLLLGVGTTALRICVSSAGR
jgi:hypothetical protein